MKKISIIALVLVLTLCTFTGCRGKQETTTPTTRPTTAPTSRPTTAPTTMPTTVPTTTPTMPTITGTEPMATDTNPGDTAIGDSGMVGEGNTDNPNSRTNISGRF